jgi:hypothetical protein
MLHPHTASAMRAYSVKNADMTASAWGGASHARFATRRTRGHTYTCAPQWGNVVVSGSVHLQRVSRRVTDSGAFEKVKPDRFDLTPALGICAHLAAVLVLSADRLRNPAARRDKDGQRVLEPARSVGSARPTATRPGPPRCPTSAP